MLFDDLIVLDCGVINTESFAEGKEEKKRVWTKRKDDEKNQMLSHETGDFFFLNDGLFSEISKFKELRGEVWE